MNMLIRASGKSGYDRYATSNDVLNLISQENLRKHTKTLSSEEYEGRLPATIGEEKTVTYLKDAFSQLGYLEGGKDASLTLQPVPLRRHTPIENKSLDIHLASGKTLSFANDKHFVSSTSRAAAEASVTGSIVFVGYGIIAPEYDWNDYKGVDVSNKWVLMLVNDPGFHSHDEKLFKGQEMTYYGRWTYKFEEAGRQGAAGCIIVHNTEAAGYPFSIVQQGRRTPSFVLSEDESPRCQIDSWINEESAESLFAACGKSFTDCTKEAATRDFKPFELPQVEFATSSLTVAQDSLVSLNVIGKLKGTERPEEAIVYSAHWDHLGVIDGGTCCGARDNALSVAAVLELAKAHKESPPKRSVIFFIPTAEEQGLLGSLHYTMKPLVPLANTVACLNMDMLNIFGKTKDICFYGDGKSELDEYAKDAAKKQGRIVSADPVPESGLYYRSDHFSFAKGGVPGLFIAHGFDHRERGREWLLAKSAKWVKSCYHKPMDMYIEDDKNEWCWNLEGAMEDIELLLRIGLRLANESTFPKWYPGAEFARK